MAPPLAGNKAYSVPVRLDGSAAIFIECKAKRIRLDAKLEILDGQPLEEELAKLASAVVQAYGTIADYRAGHHPEYPFDPQRRIYPLIVTLDEWYAFGPIIPRELDRLVGDQMARRGLDASWLRDMPYAIASVATLERLAQVCLDSTIDRVFRAKLHDETLRLWHFDPFLAQHFPAEIQRTRVLFPEGVPDLPMDPDEKV